MFIRIWQSLKNFLQKLLNTHPDGAASSSIVGGKKPPKPYKPLSDADYEYLFSQLLEGIAYGWQPGRIQRFFDTLEERGQKEGWLDWLERYEVRVLAAPKRDRELGRRLVKLGEQTHSLPSNSPVRKIGAIASRIGSSLLASPTPPKNIGQENRGDASREGSPPLTEVEPAVVEEETPSVDSTPTEASQIPATPSAAELSEIPLEEVLAQLEQNPTLAHQVAEQLGLEIADPQAAIREIVRQLQPDPPPPATAVNQGEDPEAWFNRGVQQYELEDFAEAIACWNRAIELQPNYYQAWSNRGLALKNLGQWEEVLSSYDRALELEPTYDKAWYNRGIALGELGRHDEAIASFDRVLELNPDDYKTWYSRGNTLQRDRQYSEAIASYDRALELKADLPEIWYERGNALKHSEHYPEAIASYDRALELKADLPEIWCGRGDVLVETGSYEEAIASYDRALQLQGDAWEVWLGRSRAAKLSDRADLLLSSLSAVAQSNSQLNQRGEGGQIASLTAGLHNLYPNTHPEGWGRLHWHLGQIYYRQGRERDRPFELWREAVGRYNEALTTLTEATFPLIHLEVLPDLIQVLWGLEKTAQASKLLQRGVELRQQLLENPNYSETEKRQIALQGARLDELSVDLAVQSGELIAALEQAEQNKARSLPDSPSAPLQWQAVQQLLNPTTAIVCWHLSSVALTTFILRQDTAEPIVLGQPANEVVNVVLTPSLRSKIKSAQGDREELNHLLLALLDLAQDSDRGTDYTPPDECPEALQRLKNWQAWAKDWEHLEEKTPAWQQNSPEMLARLAHILDVPAIVREIERESSQMPQTKIENLILIPHLDLYRLPLPALFSRSFAGEEQGAEPAANLTISSFPSLQLLATSHSDT